MIRNALGSLNSGLLLLGWRQRATAMADFRAQMLAQ